MLRCSHTLYTIDRERHLIQEAPSDRTQERPYWISLVSQRVQMCVYTDYDHYLKPGHTRMIQCGPDSLKHVLNGVIVKYLFLYSICTKK